MSLASGSSGNCYYLGHEDGGILIDAGIPVRSISKALKPLDISLDSGHIKGVIVTHEHADHVRTVGVLGSVYHIPIYASVPVHNSIQSSRFISEDLGASRRNIELGQHLSLAGLDITSFLVPHDSVLNFGYYIRCGEFSFTLATDIGHVTSEIKHYAGLAKYLVVEANYDPEMLRSGPYPSFLKERVASPEGHLSNTEAADLIAEVYTPHMQHIWLCHLSKDNNHPDLCWKTVENKLYYDKGVRVGRSDDAGTLFAYGTKDVIIDVLSRVKPTAVYHLEQ